MAAPALVRTRTVVVAAAWVVANGLAAGSLVLLALDSQASVAEVPVWAAVAMYLVYLPLPTVGALVTLRRPGNAIGPMLLIAGISIFAYFTSTTYAAYVLVAHPELPGVAIAAWVGAWVFEPYVVVASVFLSLLYPDGRFISPRWRVTGWFALALTVGQSVTSAFGRPVTPMGVPNPLAVAAPDRALAAFDRCRAATTRVVRLRRLLRPPRLSAHRERAPGPWSSLIDLATLALPVAIAVAVFRYRLYDIDVLIERTLVYGALSATVALTYWLLVLVLQSALRPITGGGELAVAASTLAALALVQPLRSRIQRGVDRRFYRSRYDAARTLDAFSVRLRDEVDLDAVRGGLLDAVRDTVQPAHVSVRLR